MQRTGLGSHRQTGVYLLGEYSQALIAKVISGEEKSALTADIPARQAAVLCAVARTEACSTAEKLKVYVSGDIGCYTLGALRLWA